MAKKLGSSELFGNSNLSIPDLALAAAKTQQVLEDENGKLSDRYVWPPMSVFNSASGDWQSRKRVYLGMGIQSELGRGEGLATYNGSPNNDAGDDPMRADLNTYRRDSKLGKTYNSGGPAELAATFKQANNPGSANDTRPGRDGGKYEGGHAWLGHGAKTYNTQEWVQDKGLQGLSQGQTGTSIFDPVLCELMYRWFCPLGGVVLDPFAGGSVRGLLAAMWGRGYVGIDLRAEQVAANQEQAHLAPPASRLRWLTGDAMNVDTLVGKSKFDFVFSCPPYYNLEQYSYMDEDLSNKATYAEFMDDYERIVGKTLLRLRQDRFAAFVVGNFRNADGLMVDLVGDTIRAFEHHGVYLYNEIIYVTPAGSLPIRVRNQFRASRKIGKTHQQILVFVKGDARKAAEVCRGAIA